MALEAALSNLCRSLKALGSSLHELLYTVTEDAPRRYRVILVDHIGEEVSELEGWTKESLEPAEAAERAASQPYDLNHLRRSLAQSQAAFQRLSQTLVWRLFSYEQIVELLELGHRRKGEWAGWVKSVLSGMEKSRPFFKEVEATYVACWQELAERLITGPVSVQMTNIGQQITTEALESESRRAVGSGIT